MDVSFADRASKNRFFIEALFEILGLLVRLQRNLGPTTPQGPFQDSLRAASDAIDACIDYCEKEKLA